MQPEFAEPKRWSSGKVPDRIFLDFFQKYSVRPIDKEDIFDYN